MFSKNKLKRVRKILHLKKFGDLNLFRITHTQAISNEALTSSYYVVNLLEAMKNEVRDFINSKIEEIKSL
jgi:hypothetical protein